MWKNKINRGNRSKNMHKNQFNGLTPENMSRIVVLSTPPQDVESRCVRRWRFSGESWSVALHCALELSAGTLHVFSDSEVGVKQMRGEYICRNPRLYSLHRTCRKLARSLDFSISHIPRENNLEANRLANSAVRSKASVVVPNQG